MKKIFLSLFLAFSLFLFVGRVADARVANSLEVQMNPGYNFFSLPYKQSLSFDDVCKAYPVISVSKQDGYINPVWKEYKCGEPKLEKFRFEEKVGYLLKAKESFTMKFSGDPITNTNYKHVQEGWTSVGFPMAGSKEFVKASDLCRNLPGSSVKVVEIDRWYNSGWVAHLCGLPFNDFNLVNSEGYYLRSVK